MADDQREPDEHSPPRHFDAMLGQNFGNTTESNQEIVGESRPNDHQPPEEDNFETLFVRTMLGAAEAFFGHQTRDQLYRMSPFYPANHPSFSSLPVGKQREKLKQLLDKLKQDLHQSHIVQLVNAYWPFNIKLPVEPVAANGAAHLILLQTDPTVIPAPSPDGHVVRNSIELDEFLFQFYRSKMTLPKLSQGAADSLQYRTPFEGWKRVPKRQAREVVRRYQCPRQETCPAKDDDCVFSHDLTTRTPELPNYVCFNHLVHKCDEELRDWRPKKDGPEKPKPKKPEPKENGPKNGGHKKQQTCDNDECRFGLHVSAQELADGFDTNPANQERIQAYRAQYPDEVYDCIICRQNIRLDRRVPTQMEYCLFSGCNHVYCVRCIIKCSKNNTDHTQRRYECACKCDSTKVLFQLYEPVINDPDEKRAVFETLPPASVHSHMGFIKYKRSRISPWQGRDHCLYINELHYNNTNNVLPSRVIDIMIRVKLDIDRECTLAYVPPMLDNHFGLPRETIAQFLDLLSGDGQALYEFDDNTSSFIPFQF